ncbi:MAG: FAD-dependent oxidoreductase [Treponema sp.]|jgi:hypothetical protein|nr:FAD-dependent oxidoreductase [Treponema sp.]
MIDLTKLYDRTPKTDKVYDVIVAGGGPAGIGAALAAAVNGASVLILEGRSHFGGTAAAAMWMRFNWLYRDNDYHTRGGVNKIFADTVEKWGPVAAIKGDKEGLMKRGAMHDGGNLSIHPEYLKKILFDLFERYGIDYTLYSPVIGVVKDGAAIRGVIAQCKEGKVTYRGKVVIDATGDGDVAYNAGCEMENRGSSVSGWRAPITLLFALINVDTDRFFEWYLADKIVLRGIDFPNRREAMTYAAQLGYFVPTHFSSDRGTVPGIVNFNYQTTRGWFFDGLDSYDLTCVEKLGIIQAAEFMRFAKDLAVPGLEKAELLRTGAFAAVRETRRLAGEYVFTEADLLNGTDFPDEIARKYGGRDPMGEKNPGVNIKQGAQYPYRSLLPKDIDGLLVAGRCGSTTFDGHYGGKSMGNMMVMGQAAGVAAALCSKNGVQPRALDYKLIQKKLDEMGVVL